jgi:hypothetical protein
MSGVDGERQDPAAVLAVPINCAPVEMLRELTELGLVPVTCFDDGSLLELVTEAGWVDVVIVHTGFSREPDKLVRTLRGRVRCPVLLVRDAPLATQLGALGFGDLRWGGLRLEARTGVARWRHEPIPLTTQQFRLLWRLCQARGGVVTVDQLSDWVYDGRVGDDRGRVMAHVRRIRRLIEPDLRNPRFILAARGVGFRLAAAGDCR